MPLILVSQPQAMVPQPKHLPIRFVWLTDEHLFDLGSAATFSVTFESAPAFNGEEITVKGLTFEVDNSVPFTETTFKTDAGVEDTAFNFMRMLQCNYEFKDWTFFVERVLSPTFGWRVVATANEFAEQSDWTFDYSNLSLDVSHSETNGTNTVRNNWRMLWQLFDDEGAVSAEMPADAPFFEAFPFTSVIEVNVLQYIRDVQTVFTTRPSLGQAVPVVDENYQRDFYLRFVGVSIDSACNRQYQKMGESSKFTAVNAVMQLEDTRAFRVHTTNGTRTVRFLTDRSMSANICPGSYEWVHVWVEENAFKVGPFRTKVEFFDASGNSLQVNYFAMAEDYRKAHVIPVGTANAMIKNVMPSATARYEITVVAVVLDGDEVSSEVQYSETMTKIMDDCQCKAAEVYFLEDRGSWETVSFERVGIREVEQQAVNVEREVDYFDVGRDYLYAIGGESSTIRQAETPFSLITERITEGNRKKYERMLLSSRFYIRTSSDVGEVLRPIVPNRETFQVKLENGVNRLRVTFRFNTKRSVL
jgi:hypothetical protein